MSQNGAADTDDVIALADAISTPTPLDQNAVKHAFPGVLTCPECGALLTVVETTKRLACPWELDGGAEMLLVDPGLVGEATWKAGMGAAY